MKKGLIIFLFLSLSFFSCRPDAKKEQVKEEKLRPVNVVAAKLSKQGKLKRFSGVTRASVTSRLSFRVSGTLTGLFVDVGDSVKKGELLAKLDPTDYEIKVQEVSASLARAKAQWRNAKASYARVQALYERGNASLNELDATRAAASSGEAAVKSVKKQLELVQRRLGYTKLYSPAGCRVASLDSEENENVLAGQQLMMLNCGDKTEVKIAVPSSYIDKIKKGGGVKVFLDSYKDIEFIGEIKDVGVSPSGLMTTYPVIISLDSKGSSLRPGMSAEVVLNTQDLKTKAYIWLPPVSVLEDSDGKFVFTAEKSGKEVFKIKKVKIETGKITASGIPVLKGVKTGDLVVSAGLSQVRDGLKVRVIVQDM